MSSTDHQAQPLANLLQYGNSMAVFSKQSFDEVKKKGSEEANRQKEGGDYLYLHLECVFVNYLKSLLDKKRKQVCMVKTIQSFCLPLISVTTVSNTAS